jgi:hypothetical protein
MLERDAVQMNALGGIWLKEMMIHEYDNIVKSAYNDRLGSAIWYRKYYACRPNMRVEVTHANVKTNKQGNMLNTTKSSICCQRLSAR